MQVPLIRTALAKGKLWRLLTGHLVHFGADHFIWNIGVLLVLGALLPTPRARDWMLILGGSALAVSCAVWLFQPQFVIYRGLSGIACAYFGAVLTQLFLAGRQTRDLWLTILVIAAGSAFVGKTVYELAHARTLFVSTTVFEPVPLAHLVGFISGVADFVWRNIPASHRQITD